MQPVTIPAPSSKSLSHRFLAAAALAPGLSRISHVLESDDTARTREILTTLGAAFTRTGEGEFTVQGTGGRLKPGGARPEDAVSCFVGESGTTCRLLLSVLAAGSGFFRVHGAGRMHKRPLGELTAVLEKLGASIAFEELPNCPPVLLGAKGLNPDLPPGGRVDIGCGESSQYLSGLLLAAPLGSGLRLSLGGDKVVSWPYISLTLETLDRFGLSFAVETRHEDGAWQIAPWRTLTDAEPGKVRFTVPAGTYKAGEYRVEGDWSGASYFLAAGAIGPRPVYVSGLSGNSLQGDAALLHILEDMGARVDRTENGVTVHPAPLRGVVADLGRCPDLAPTVAALAAHAEGETRIVNAAHLKIKESDRREAPAQELRKAGCDVSVTDDGLRILPPPNGLAAPAPGLVFSAHGDHRMAMGLSLLGLPGLSGGSGFHVPLDDPACVSKSFPHFWTLWDKVRT